MAQKQKQNQKKVVEKANKNRPNDKSNKRRELENKFFRIGLIVVVVVVAVVAAIFIFNLILNKNNQEKENPFKDHLNVSYSDFQLILGTEPDFQSVSDDDVREAVVAHQYDTMYFYFYRSSNILENHETVIKGLKDVDGIPIFFIDLDDAAYSEIESLTLAFVYADIKQASRPSLLIVNFGEPVDNGRFIPKTNSTVIYNIFNQFEKK